VSAPPELLLDHVSCVKMAVEVFAHFHAVTVKVTVVCEIDCLACQGEFFVNILLDVKENDEHALDFALRMVSRFSVSVILDFSYTAHTFFTERLSNHCQGIRCTFSMICTKFGALLSSDPSRNRIRRDA
jgi:predicted metal-binding protein